MISDLALVLLGFALTAGTAVFVAAEFSLVALDPAQLEGAADDAVTRRRAPRPRRIASVRRALKRLTTQLSGAQVGITLTTILLGFTTQPALARLIARALEPAPWIAQTAGAALSVGLAIVLVNVVSMVGGELAPKNLALAEPLRTAAAVAPFQLAFTALARPVIAVLGASANAVLRPFGVEPVEELSGARSAKELASLVRRSAEAGTLDQALAFRLTRSLTLGELRAIDVMTDRTAMVVVGRDDSALDVTAAARESGHSTFPVIDGSRDAIVGLVALRRAVAVPFDRRAEVPVAALMTDAMRVPETAPLGPVLVELRAAGASLAVVVDEYGGTSGLLTLEDVVEEIVGDVADEHDRRRAGARRTRDGSWRAPGQMRPDELRGLAGIALPESAAYETLGGLVMAALGRIPVAGDQVEVPGGRLRVEAMDGRRVTALRIWPAPGEGGG
ncbi:MAG: hemolysin family protein [Bifidobacteriaceae bacterium]|nr:hemolysin family protein [Bifidobacteriaceae bacterium]